MAEVAVKIKEVYKGFRQGKNFQHVLKGICLDIHAGQLAMIVGPSGCGKTTLLSTIAGTLCIDQGSINLFGADLHALPQKEITRYRKKKIGFIFQQYHLIRTLNCLENVSIPLLLNGMKRRQAEEQAAYYLEKVGLKGREKENPKILSGGQQQRVAIARALVHNPQLVICDEPTAALDADTGARIMELLVEIARMPERCVIVVTHDNRIFKFGDSITEMNDGKVVIH